MLKWLRKYSLFLWITFAYRWDDFETNVVLFERLVELFYLPFSCEIIYFTGLVTDFLISQKPQAAFDSVLMRFSDISDTVDIDSCQSINCKVFLMNFARVLSSLNDSIFIFFGFAKFGFHRAALDFGVLIDVTRSLWSLSNSTSFFTSHSVTYCWMHLWRRT